MQLVISKNLSAELAANPGVEFHRFEPDEQLAHQPRGPLILVNWR